MKKSNNSNLSAAKAAKNDEFYTRLYDIEMELKHYKEQFKGKVVYCNCDDCFESNFFKYFALNFNQLGLKKLITTCYAESKVGKQFRLFDEDGEPQKKAYKMVINEIPDMNGDGAVDLTDVELLIKNDKNVLTVLNGDGDFRSEECVELLKEADIVVTNPPFSLFREYVAQLVEYGKQFIIIGNKNAITYKEIFPIIKENKLWLGYGSPNEYILPNGEVTKQVNGLCRWFTNLPTEKRNQPIDLYKHYNPEEYPKYDNYDAIEVSKVVDIPMDYNGVMGVPITFLDKYCPTQFEIVGLLNSSDKELAGIETTREYNDFKEVRQDGSFTKSSGRKTKGNPVLLGKPKKGNYYINPKTNECVFSAYARILIKRIN